MSAMWRCDNCEPNELHQRTAEEELMSDDKRPTDPSVREEETASEPEQGSEPSKPAAEPEDPYKTRPDSTLR